jgi:hypothetical protein
MPEEFQRFEGEVRSVDPQSGQVQLQLPHATVTLHATAFIGGSLVRLPQAGDRAIVSLAGGTPVSAKLYRSDVAEAARV